MTEASDVPRSENHISLLPNIQPGILSPVQNHASFLVIHLRDNISSQSFKHVKLICSEVPSLVTKVLKQFGIESDGNGGDDDASNLTATIGFSSSKASLWFSKFSKPQKEGQKVIPYQTLKSKYGDLPATGGDILLHIKCSRQDICFEFAQQFLASIQIISEGGQSIVTKYDDLFGFMYRKDKKTGLGRDFSGFEDGTENPKELENKIGAAIIKAEDDVENQGGSSWCLLQVWVHDKLQSFLKMPLSQQEEAIGRTKKDSQEFEVKHIKAHISRVVIPDKKTGEEAKFVRQSVPFGNLQKKGLIFVEFSDSLEKMNEQLERMCGLTNSEVTGVDTVDFVMQKLSTCISGNYFYIPSLIELKQLS